MITPPTTQSTAKKPARVLKSRTSLAIAKRKRWRAELVDAVMRCRTANPGPNLDKAKDDVIRVVPRINHWHGKRAKSVLRAITVRHLTGVPTHD